METVPIYFIASLAEIAGCFAFWAWFRLDKSVFRLVPGMLSFAVFAWLLALSPANQAGRAFAVYGSIYIVSSLRLWSVQGHRPDQWDIIGAGICLIGAGIILWAPRII